MTEKKASLGCVLGTRAVESGFRRRIIAAVNRAMGHVASGRPDPTPASSLSGSDAGERDVLPPLTAWEEWEVAEERVGRNPLQPHG